MTTDEVGKDLQMEMIACDGRWGQTFQNEELINIHDDVDDGGAGCGDDDGDNGGGGSGDDDDNDDDDDQDGDGCGPGSSDDDENKGSNDNSGYDEYCDGIHKDDDDCCGMVLRTMRTKGGEGGRR